MLAARTGRPFLDADAVLEADAGCSIHDLFTIEGEDGFRDRESATLRKLASGPPTIVATGGGAILRPTNRELLRATGFVVWLQASAELLWNRISTDPTTAQRRPNLAEGGFQEVKALLAAREPLYAATAHTVVDATRSPEEVASDILGKWNRERSDQVDGTPPGHCVHGST
ncbi:MAG: shikimate kinase [Fimbriiglobus sp.]|nr:shikimate kinase [Fimbriiglobus sp.]